MPPTDTWTKISQADVNDALTVDEQNAFIAAGSGGASIPGIVGDVVGEVRGYCRVRNTLGPEGTIPCELKSAALDIIAWRIAKRVSGSSASRALKDGNDDAVKRLERVADGTFRISAPLTPSTDVTSAPAPSMETVEGAGINGPFPVKRREFGPHEEHGI